MILLHFNWCSYVFTRRFAIIPFFGSTSESLDTAKVFVDETLSKYACAEKSTDDREGRIGPKTVKFDVNAHTGLFIVSPDRSSIIAQGNFCTMRANTALYKGKWMYELQLGSKGVMQVGWGTSRCKYDMESGVGTYGVHT